jgi:hypothetical protein
VSETEGDEDKASQLAGSSLLVDIGAMPLASEYSFTDFCQLLTRLSMKKGREKREELRRFFAAWRSKASDDPAVSPAVQGRAVFEHTS